MSTRKEPPAPPFHARRLTAFEALYELRKIDVCAERFCRTAPRAAEAFGGMAAVQASSEMTCIGAVPRLTVEQWEPFAAEHADIQWGRVNREPEGVSLSEDPHRSRTAGAGTEVRR